VVGPLARSATDLQLALDVVAGPEPEEAKAYSLALPPPRHARLDAYRVLILDRLPQTPLDDEVRAALHDLAGRLEDLGAQVIREPERAPDATVSRDVYMGLLNAAMTRGQPGAQPIDAHQWMALLDGQLAIRRRWAELFREVDVVLAPTFCTVAYPHVDEPDREKRTLTINGREVSYWSGLAWPAVALLPNLPSTAFPAGFTKGGLPIGLQAIGPHLEDRTTIAFAGLIEREFGGFKAPPGL
jgi:amidase